MVREEGRALVPQALVDYLKPIVSLPKGRDGKQLLALPPDMLRQLNGMWTHLDDYVAAENTQYWQCGQSEAGPTFPLPGQYPNDGRAYEPTNDVLSIIANATRTTVGTLSQMEIQSSQPLVPPGSWCGMPAAGFDDFSVAKSSFETTSFFIF